MNKTTSLDGCTISGVVILLLNFLSMKLSKPTSSRRKLLKYFSLDEQSRLFCENTQSTNSRLSHDKHGVVTFHTITLKYVVAMLLKDTNSVSAASKTNIIEVNPKTPQQPFILA